MREWNLLAEVLGFLSACVLLWPAWKLNRTLRDMLVTQERLEKSQFKFAKTLAQSDDGHAKVTQPRWSLVDQWLLTVGAATLVLSFLIKVIVIWVSP